MGRDETLSITAVSWGGPWAGAQANNVWGEEGTGFVRGRPSAGSWGSLPGMGLVCGVVSLGGGRVVECAQGFRTLRAGGGGPPHQCFPARWIRSSLCAQRRCSGV